MKSAGRLISGGGSDNEIQIGCNIHQLPQHVNAKFSAKSRPGAAAYLPNDRRLFSAGATVVIGDPPDCSPLYRRDFNTWV